MTKLYNFHNNKSPLVSSWSRTRIIAKVYILSYF